MGVEKGETRPLLQITEQSQPRYFFKYLLKYLPFQKHPESALFEMKTRHSSSALLIPSPAGFPLFVFTTFLPYYNLLRIMFIACCLDYDSTRAGVLSSPDLRFAFPQAPRTSPGIWQIRNGDEHMKKGHWTQKDSRKRDSRVSLAQTLFS